VESVEPSPNETLAARLRGFGPVGIIAFLVIILTGNIMLPNMIVLPMGAVLVLLWVKLSQTPWDEIGYSKPNNLILVIIGGIIFGIAFKFIMKSIVMPLFGADPINQSYHFLAGNKALLPIAIGGMLVAGFSEETVFRGFMFERFRKLFGSVAGATALIVLITTAWFAFGHYSNQGVTGVEQAAVTGVTFGTIYAVTRNIWFVMIAHAAFDLTALWMIYENLESAIAHFIFK
jgi:membrane protease YdiL (CAAX protease family)